MSWPAPWHQVSRAPNIDLWRQAYDLVDKARAKLGLPSVDVWPE